MITYIETLSNSISLHHLNIILLLGIALFGGTIGGKLLQKIKVPQVVGYMLIGVILGRSGFQIVDKHSVEILQPFSLFALALIGFMIGGELKLKIIKKYGKQFLYILLFESLTTFIVVSGAITAISYFIYSDLKTSIALGLLLGSISSATAPAATTDVLWENKTKGPLTTMVLGIVAMDDGVALLLFAISASIAGTLLGTFTESISLNIIHLFYEIGMALLIGYFFGFFLSKLLQKVHEEDKVLPFSIGAILLLIGLSIVLKIDILLAAMTMGFVMINYKPRKMEDTFNLVGKFTPPIYVLFFVLVGAKINVKNIDTVIAVLTIVYLTGRTSGKMFGAYWGAKASKAAATVRKYLPYCLFSQAGVAIGLSILVGQKFQGNIGDTIVIVIATTTFVVQIIGPSFVRYAVIKAEEVGLNITENDLFENCIVKDILDRNLTIFTEDMNIEEVLKIYSEQDYLYYPVKNKNDEIAGVISIDTIKNTFRDYQLADILVAYDIMEPAIATCSPDDYINDVMEILKINQLEYLPIIDKNNKLTGLLERRNIQRLITTKLFEFRNKAEKLDKV